MKTIKIFLASSEELESDRIAFINLIRKLNKTYEKRGVSLELIDGDDFDVADNEEVRASDMFLALFQKEAGKFVIEEFDVAKEEFKKKSLPKAYIYCKDINEGDSESKELTEFKERLITMANSHCSKRIIRGSMPPYGNLTANGRM